MKKLHRKGIVLLIALALLLTCAVGGTVAYLSVGTGPVTNTFTPAELDTVIVENFGDTYDGVLKSSIAVKNQGTIDAYVRVGVYGYWAVKDGSGAEKIIAPWASTVTPANGWLRSADSWYYYPQKLAPNATTTNLLSTAIKAADKPAAYPNAYLVVTVIHQSIQTEPAKALTDAHWGWTPMSAQ